MLIKANIRKDQRVIFCAKILKITINNKYVIVSKGTCALNDRAGRLRNYFLPNSFTHYQAERIKKVTCVQIFVEKKLKPTLHLHTRLGHSNVISVLKVLISIYLPVSYIPACIIFHKCIQHTCTPANRKRYHNVSIWLYVGLVATQHRLNLTMMLAMSCRKVKLK